MLKEELIALYKAKPELIEEHKRLVNVLRTGSKKQQVKEAERQLRELKEMMDKADRCWEGYEPTPGKKPYEKGSCRPIEKQEVLTFDKQESGGWRIKIKGKPGYHDVKDVVDMGPQQHNSYLLHDGTKVMHHEVEDLDISPKRSVNVRKEDVEKSSYGPKEMELYNPTDNIKRKSTRTGEVREDVGRNKAVRQYTSSAYGSASQQADHQSKKDKKMSAKNPVRSMKDMSEAELNAIRSKYTTKSDLDDKIAEVKIKYSPKKDKSFRQQVKEVKTKYADKPQMTDDQKATQMKNKYINLFKSGAINHLFKEVSTRQPTDDELKLILEYNGYIQQEQQAPAHNISSHDIDESGY